MDGNNRSLSNSCTSLSTALSSLREINNTLDQNSKDFNRMSNVLNMNQVFGIVTESEINETKSQLASETQPQIEKLVARIENELARLDRKEKTLSSKAELQQGRLQEVTSTAAYNSTATKNIEKMEKLRQLKEKRDRLAYSLSRLNLKGRKVRMSMAFAGGGLK